MNAHYKAILILQNPVNFYWCQERVLLDLNKSVFLDFFWPRFFSQFKNLIN